MDTKYKLIKPAANKLRAINLSIQHIQSYIQGLAEAQDMTPVALSESVTNILANIAVTAEEGKPLQLMHTDSIASFMAGVEAISQSLPVSQDQTKRENTLRVLAAAAVGPDGNVSYAATPIAQLGARKEELRNKYLQLVNAYAAGSNPEAGKALAQAARMLQQQIDQAMRQGSAPIQNQPAAAGSGQPGSAPGNL